MTFAVPERCSFKRGIGCLVVVACLALAAGPAPLAGAAEPPAAEIDVEAIPPPVPEEWAAELATVASCTSCTGADPGGIGSRFRVNYD
jgi:hypothetical protein